MHRIGLKPFLPTLSFAEKRLKYQYPGYASNRKVESVFVELPFQFRYKSEPYHDVRLFLLAGLKYSFDVASDSRTKQAETLVKIAPNDFSFETGVDSVVVKFKLVLNCILF